MEHSPSQLDTLVAIADLGSFEAAARGLHVTPSAVSQRIRALESAAGQVLVSRGTPCRPTVAGEALVRLGRQLRLLYDEARATLEAPAAVTLTVAVNADSLATWFRAVLGEVADWEGIALRLSVEDQAHSQDLLRRGEVLAAVTSEPAPVQGCTVERLGVLRYLPVATPHLADRWRRGRTIRWSEMPVVVFNDKDDLQTEVLRHHGVIDPPPVVHQVPASVDFHEAVRLGLGWATLPEPQAAPDLAAGRLVRLGQHRVDVPLHWQRWRLDSPALGRVTEAVRAAARTQLRRPAPGRRTR